MLLVRYLGLRGTSGRSCVLALALAVSSCCCLVAECCAQDSVVTQEVNGIDFQVAQGLSLEKIDSEGLVHWPVVADWDREGRLVVVESGGVAWPIEEHNEQKLHRIVRLFDADGDGIFDERIIAVDNLPFTEGVLCLGNEILASAPPYIWKFVDADGDGVCEDREIWFDGQTITGCANDLHGPYLGFDGWIYWCKGAFAKQEHLQIDGTTVNDEAAHIYRRRREGGAVESVVSGGMDNPVEVAFSPAGDMFFTSTFLQHPRDGKRDGIAHAVYGSVFGKDHHVINKLQRTGPLAPVMAHLGAAAPSGLMRLSTRSSFLSGNWPLANWLVAAEFNLHRISAHKLVQTRATYESEKVSLLETDRVDFHPTDVLEDGDGNLIVLDTGGWYDLCCPTSRVDQKVAPGGVYRLRSTEIERQQYLEVDWDRQSVASCIDLLGDQRPWIQREAVLRLARYENSACIPLIRLLEKPIGPREDLQVYFRKRERAIQTLSMIGTTEALTLLSRFLQDVSASKQLIEIRSIVQVLATHRFEPATEILIGLLSHPSVAVSRVAVEALGRIGKNKSQKVSKQIVEACSNAVQWNSTFKHSVLFALLQLEEVEALKGFLVEDAASQKQLAIEALHLLDSADLQDHVLAAAFAKDTSLRVAARKVLFAHPEWADGAGDFLHKFQESDLTQGRFVELVEAWKDQPFVQRFVEEQIDFDDDQEGAMRLLGVWADKIPRVLVLKYVLAIEHAPYSVAALLYEGRSRVDNEEVLTAIRHKLSSTEDLDLARSLLSVLPEGADIALPHLVEQFVEQKDFASLARIALEEETLREILGSMKQLPLRDLEDCVEIYARSNDDLSVEFLEAIRIVPAAKMLDENVLKNAFKGRKSSVRRLAMEVNEVLHQPAEDVTRVVQELLKKLPKGDPVDGLQIFRGTKASCSACHQIGYFGGQVGPELTRIGKSRTEEALLEAILFPSSRIEQGFRPTKVLTEDGAIYSGLESRDESGRIRLQLNAEKSITLEQEVIETKMPSDTSIMPAGIRELLSDQQLADLLALLKAAR